MGLFQLLRDLLYPRCMGESDALSPRLNVNDNSHIQAIKENCKPTCDAVEITSDNYKDYAPLDVVAFSLSHAGACGEGGAIYMITSDGVIYYTNIIATIKLEEAFILCPPLSSCHFNPSHSRAAVGWVPIYIGLGNFLVLKKHIVSFLFDVHHHCQA